MKRPITILLTASCLAAGTVLSSSEWTAAEVPGRISVVQQAEHVGIAQTPNLQQRAIDLESSRQLTLIVRSLLGIAIGLTALLIIFLWHTSPSRRLSVARRRSKRRFIPEPEDDDATTPPTDDHTATPPTNDDTTTPPTDDHTTTPLTDDHTTTPPTDDHTTTPLTNNNTTTTPPNNDNNTAPPTDDNTATPPANDNDVEEIQYAARRTVSAANVGSPARFNIMTAENAFDPDAMVKRFRERAAGVKRRNLPPVAGEERTRFLKQAQLDFQDFSIIGDAEVSVEGGVLHLTVDLRPPETRS